MASIPPIQRLSVEDFSAQSSWIAPLLNSLNQYMERTTAALSRSLTVKDNMAGDLLTVELNGTFPVRVAWTAKTRPQAVLVGNTYRTDLSAVTLSNAVQVQWSFNQNGQLQIDGVVGISPTPAAKYKLTLVCLS